MAGGGAIFEPVGGNTAAAVAIATLQDAFAAHGDALMLVIRSRSRNLDRQAVLADRGGGSTRCARRPHHRPSASSLTSRRRATAISRSRAAKTFAMCRNSSRSPTWRRRKSYLASGEFYWNTGIFLFRAGAMREAFQKLRPDIWDAAEAAFAAATTDLSGLYMPLDLYRGNPVQLDRLCGHGKGRAERHGAGQNPLERPGFLAVAARRRPGRQTRQRDRRRRGRHGLRKFPTSAATAICCRRSA